MSPFDLSLVRAAKDGGGSLPAGVYHVEVTGVEERTSQAGNIYIRMKLSALTADGEPGPTASYDNLNFTEKSAGMTKAKLSMLGVELDPEKRQAIKLPAEMEPEELLGRRCWIRTVENSNGYMDVELTGKHGAKCGYWSEDEPPAPEHRTAAPGNDDKAPWDQ